MSSRCANPAAPNWVSRSATSSSTIPRATNVRRDRVAPFRRRPRPVGPRGYRPALLAGKVVLSDRYLDSSTVYQGIARNLAADPVAQINHFAIGNVMPNLTVVIDVPTTVSLKRLKQRASDLPDRMERENIDFYKRSAKATSSSRRACPSALSSSTAPRASTRSRRRSGAKSKRALPNPSEVFPLR